MLRAARLSRHSPSNKRQNRSCRTVNRQIPRWTSPAPVQISNSQYLNVAPALYSSTVHVLLCSVPSAHAPTHGHLQIPNSPNSPVSSVRCPIALCPRQEEPCDPMRSTGVPLSLSAIPASLGPFSAKLGSFSKTCSKKGSQAARVRINGGNYSRSGAHMVT